MAENKKAPEQTEKVQKAEVKETQEKKKMGTGGKIAIGCGVVLLLGLLVLGGLAIAGVSFISKVSEEFDGMEIIEEMEEDFTEEFEDSEFNEEQEEYTEEEEFTFKQTTEQGLDGELESESILTDRFPEDIPLSGGKLTSSSYDDRRIEAELDVDATVGEVKEWYIDALREEGWEITSQSEDEPVEGWQSMSITFESTDGERRGQITIEQTQFNPIPHVTIVEILY